MEYNGEDMSMTHDANLYTDRGKLTGERDIAVCVQTCSSLIVFFLGVHVYQNNVEAVHVLKAPRLCY